MCHRQCLNEAANPVPRLVAGKDDLLAIGHPVDHVPIALDPALIDSLSRSRTCWQEHESASRTHPWLPICHRETGRPPSLRPEESVVSHWCCAWPRCRSVHPALPARQRARFCRRCDRSTGRDQSSQERSCSLVAPGPAPIMPARFSSRVSNSLPSGAMSCRVTPPSAW